MSSTIKLSSPATKEFWEIPVLFEDEHLLALDKPPGLLTSPDRAEPARPSLMGLLHAGIAEGKPWAVARALSYLALTHRLDSEASGVLLLAKNKASFISLANQFGADQPVKTFVLILPGTPPSPEWEVKIAIAPHPGQPGLMRADSRTGKQAHTRFAVREQFRGYTLVQAQPLTSRPHQVRVHLQHWGLSISADTLYGGKPLLLSRLKPGYRLKPGKTERPLLAHAALHAERLEVVHPVTAQPLVITAECPKDFAVALKFLRRHAAL